MNQPTQELQRPRLSPLRRRDRELTATPAARGSLPRERAPFDPEIEPGDTPTRRILPRAIVSHLTRSAIPWPRASGSQDDRPAATSRRSSHAVLMTGAGGAAVATVAALTLLVLNPSSGSLATQLESLGGRVTAGALEPTKPDVLTVSANPFGVPRGAATPKTRGTVARRSHRGRPKQSGRGRLPSAPPVGARQPRALTLRSSPPPHREPCRRAAATLRPKPNVSPLHTRRRRPPRRRRLSRRARLGAARARLRPAIDQFLESRAFLAQVHRPIRDT